MPLAPEMTGHLPASLTRRLEELGIDQPHEREVERALALPRPVERRPADADQGTLPADRQHGVPRLDHFTPPGNTHRPELPRENRPPDGFLFLVSR